MESHDPIISKIRLGPWQYFIFTYIWSWSFWIPAVLLRKNVFDFPNFLLLGLGGLGPFIVSISLTYFKEDREVWRDFWKRVIDVRRIGFVWLAVAIFMAPLVCSLGIITGILFNGVFPSFETAVEYLSNPIGFIFYLFFVFIYGPLPEEFGWRGYALDRLQKKWNALYSSLILALLWALWHWPMFFMVGTYQSGEQSIGSLRFWIDYCLGITVNTILMTWVYNNTKRSILSAVLYHFMMNFTGEFLNLISLYHYYKVMWTTIIAVLVIILYKPQSLTDPPWGKSIKISKDQF
ncbi:MAG: CPBP family intramembrane metalloprotease [Promethearchaeota archaeon]|nr:MAG: CPBP family intramembrane metalloprotease [Candidatus Lokiarchaeota archaeon]